MKQAQWHPKDWKELKQFLNRNSYNHYIPELIKEMLNTKFKRHE